MYGDGSDRIVNAQIFEQVDTPDHHDPGADSEQKCTLGIDPVAGASYRNESGEKAIDRQREIPLPAFNVRIEKRRQARRASRYRRVERNAADTLRVEGR